MTIGYHKGRVNRPLWPILWIACMLLPSGVVARAETFGIVSFETPEGVRSSSAEVVGFTDATPTSFCVYGVYGHYPEQGDPERDFQYEWSMLVERSGKLIEKPKTETTDWAGGWKLTMGAAKAYSEEQREFVYLLSVFSGYGVEVPVLINYNDDLCRPKIDAFLASISLQPPSPQTPPAVTAAAPTSVGQAVPPGLNAQEWYHSEANYSHWGTRFTPGELAALGSQGSVNWSYRFQPDGTYTFVNEFWLMNRNDDYWIVEESGTYRQDAQTIQLTPQKARRLLKDRKGNAKGSAEKLGLEPATYRYAFQYLSGMERWYLVLIPEGGKETRRDGTLHSIPDYGKAYRYGPRPRCEQRPKPADCIG